MSELLTLYQSLILQHNRDVQFQQPIPNPTHSARGANPLCGDTLDLALQINHDVICAVHFAGQMSAITRASANMMCQLLQQQTVDSALRLHDAALSLLLDASTELETSALGDFQSMRVLREFPNRIKTAVLPWATLKAALQQRSDMVSTDSLVVASSKTHAPDSN